MIPGAQRAFAAEYRGLYLNARYPVRMLYAEPLHIVFKLQFTLIADSRPGEAYHIC